MKRSRWASDIMKDTAARTARETEESPLTHSDLDAILDEIHHRIKNNFQVILSLLSMQTRICAERDSTAVLRAVQGRIRALAGLHDPLYASPDFSSIHFGQYLTALAETLPSMYNLGSRVRLQVSPADLVLDMSQALPLALIANELLSNAFEHAFPGSRTGTVFVTLAYGDSGPEMAVPHSCALAVSDDGIGLPAAIDPASGRSMGLYVVYILTEQLKGRLEVLRNGGTSTRVSFPSERRT